MGDVLESFSVNVRVRIKYAEKTRFDLWDQSRGSIFGFSHEKRQYFNSHLNV
ncbi:hypothetical protein MtrunA17_Chr8g0363581 [Medicago truncatula]|uniref:Uncharacterized protein n=1 Tax=Medicago truncatula TaxID=3880 RepID=A0A396GJA7_MEDTR|nr:hypothetical protein MtrunA17_Chr8g0363581 [Medicago truncatula]